MADDSSVYDVDGRGRTCRSCDVREAMFEQGFTELPVLGSTRSRSATRSTACSSPRPGATPETLVTADRRLAAYDVAVLDP